MSTNYTGDGTAAAIAPDLGQTPEAAPIIQLPADGDLADVASIAQAFKALANHVAWAVKPYASLSTAIRHLKRWRTSLGHTRFALDRNGLPAGTYLQLQESWGFGAGVSGPSSAQLGAYPNWYVNTSAVASGLIFVYQPAAVVTGVPSSRHGIVSISAGDLAQRVLRPDRQAALHLPRGRGHRARVHRQRGRQRGRHAPRSHRSVLLGAVGHTDPRGCARRVLLARHWQHAELAGGHAGRDQRDRDRHRRRGLARAPTCACASSTAGPTSTMARRRRPISISTKCLKSRRASTNVPTTGWAAAELPRKERGSGATIVRPTGPGDIYIGPINHACNVMPSVTT
jgi:hypothetical protein